MDFKCLHQCVLIVCHQVSCGSAFIDLSISMIAKTTGYKQEFSQRYILHVNIDYGILIVMYMAIFLQFHIFITLFSSKQIPRVSMLCRQLLSYDFHMHIYFSSLTVTFAFFLKGELPLTLLTINFSCN